MKNESPLFTEENHDVWKKLFENQDENRVKGISEIYLNYLQELLLPKDRIPSLDEINEVLTAKSGWEVIPTTGMVDSNYFFNCLAEKRFPVNISIRKLSELDFAELPDMFHDVVGHLPLLLNEKYSEAMQKLGLIAQDYFDDAEVIDILTKIYWYYFETGVISENGRYKIFGSAIVTSKGEINNVFKSDTMIEQFSVENIKNESINPFELQQKYFYVNDLGDVEKELEVYMDQKKMVKNV